MSFKASRPIIEQIKQIIPPLSSKLHKGQAGRIGIVGGSLEYTGAPFFSAISAFRLGVDLSHVICDPSAGYVIKSYSPDLIVHPILSPNSSPEDLKEQLTSLLSRLHVLVIGPGLGRDEYMQNYAKLIMKLAREREMYVVIDADGLYMVQNDPDLVRGYNRVVLTPNVVEFGRLCDTMKVPKDSPKGEVAGLLARSLGNVTILQKGPSDIISTGEETEVVDEPGGLKRAGGQGDILSGLVGCFLAWGKAYSESPKSDSDVPQHRIPLLASVAGSTLTRTAAHIAFGKLGRGMLTSDMIGEIGPAYEKHFGAAGEKGFKGSL